MTRHRRISEGILKVIPGNTKRMLRSHTLLLGFAAALWAASSFVVAQTQQPSSVSEPSAMRETPPPLMPGPDGRLLPAAKGSHPGTPPPFAPGPDGRLVPAARASGGQPGTPPPFGAGPSGRLVPAGKGSGSQPGTPPPFAAGPDGRLVPAAHTDGNQPGTPPALGPGPDGRMVPMPVSGTVNLPTIPR